MELVDNDRVDWCVGMAMTGRTGVWVDNLHVHGLHVYIYTYTYIYIYVYTSSMNHSYTMGVLSNCQSYTTSPVV